MEQKKYRSLRSESHLLNEGMKVQIRAVLEKLTQDVWVRAVLDLENGKSREMGEFLKAFALLDDKLHLELYEPGEDLEVETGLECDGMYPVTALYLADGQFSGISFRGIPGGQEINSFVIAFYNLAGAGQPLDDQVKERILALDGPRSLQVFVSLACHYCAENVILSQHIAAVNHKVRVQMTDAGLYPSLVEKYGLERVPVMLLDGTERLVGGKSMEEILAFLEK